MKELTKQQKLHVINEAIRYYKNVNNFKCLGMCGLIEGIIKNDFNIQVDWFDTNFVDRYFPEFDTYKPKVYFVWWFPARKPLPRLKYCLKIKKLLCKK